MQPLLKLSTSLAFACSGPGAADIISAAERPSWIQLGVSLVFLLTALGFLRAKYGRRAKGQWILSILFVLHPGWWISARGGDCGAYLEARQGWIWAGTAVFVLAAASIVLLNARLQK